MPPTTLLLLLALGACGRFGFGESPPPAVDAPTVIDMAPAIVDAMPDAFVRPVAPPPGRNLTLDGSSYVTIDSVCASLGTGFTIAAWIRPAPVQGGLTYSEIAAFNTPTGNANLALLQWRVAETAANYYDDYYTNGTYFDPSAPPSQWSYIAMTVDGTGLGTLFVDGDAAQTFTTPAKIPTNARFSLGQEWDNGSAGEFFVGDLDEVAVWKRARTSAELVDDMTHPPLQDPDLVAFFDFEAGAVTDRTGHGHAGTTVGGATFPTH